MDCDWWGKPASEAKPPISGVDVQVSGADVQADLSIIYRSTVVQAVSCFVDHSAR